ncbi:MULTISPECIES: DUF3784 domain-containing protein [Clostridia]
MSGFFFIVTFIFLIVGYNCIPKDQSKNYYETKLIKDFRNVFLIWTNMAI